jgi:hypothetical protein
MRGQQRAEVEQRRSFDREEDDEQDPRERGQLLVAARIRFHRLRRIFDPKSSFGLTDSPHRSQSTTASDENGAPQARQRRSSSPAH